MAFRKIILTADELDRILFEGVDKTPEELFKVKRLNELNINRIKKHGEAGFIIVSACRSQVESDNPNTDLSEDYKNWAKQHYIADEDIDKEDNKGRFLKDRNYQSDADLERMLRSSSFPYSFSPVYGGYHGTDGAVDSFEPSYIIYNYKKDGTAGEWGDLHDLALALCRKYKQDSVYVQAPGEPPVYQDCDGNTISSKSSLDFKYNRPEEEYFTTAKREKRGTPQRFTAGIQFEELYRGPGPGDYGTRMKRRKQGEIIL